MVNQVCQKLKVSERRACRVLALSRATHRYSVNVGSDEERLRSDIIRLALKYGRYGYRRITAPLNNYEGWKVNQKRVYRIWRQEGLKVPQKQPKRGRLWLNNGSCIRLKPEFKDHVWSYDFVESRTTDGRKFRVLNIIDEYTRECLACLVGRSLKNDDVIGILFELFILRAIPMNIRSDNGSEFTAKAVIKWLNETGVKTLFIEPGSPWENGYIESFNGKMRDELLNGELFTTIDEAKYLLEKWRVESNSFRPHSSLGYMPPAPEAVMLGELTLQLV